MTFGSFKDSFKKCRITNNLDDTEGHVVWEITYVITLNLNVTLTMKV